MLIVDDEVDIVELLEFVIAGAGATVRRATSAREALELLPSFKPDVMLLDIGMPDMDGYQLLSAIRSNPKLEKVPAVAVTGYGYQKDKEHASPRASPCTSRSRSNPRCWSISSMDLAEEAPRDLLSVRPDSPRHARLDRLSARVAPSAAVADRPRATGGASRALVGQEPSFAVDPAAVACQRVVCADHAMARTTIAIGLAPLARPTARVAVGRPIATAS